MPGLDGPDTARRIIQHRPETVVVLVSADADILPEAAESAGTAWSLAKSDISPGSLTSAWADARARAEEARRDAQALREEAKALRGQAGHQARRARRNAEPR
jgi:DNA-binding NtrC family response regulator